MAQAFGWTSEGFNLGSGTFTITKNADPADPKPGDVWIRFDSNSDLIEAAEEQNHVVLPDDLGIVLPGAWFGQIKALKVVTTGTVMPAGLATYLSGHTAPHAANSENFDEAGDVIADQSAIIMLVEDGVTTIQEIIDTVNTWWPTWGAGPGLLELEPETDPGATITISAGPALSYNIHDSVLHETCMFKIQSTDSPFGISIPKLVP